MLFEGSKDKSNTDAQSRFRKRSRMLSKKAEVLSKDACDIMEYYSYIKSLEEDHHKRK